MARIAFFLPDLSGGGAERVVLALMEGLLERGHNVDLLLCREEGVLIDELDPRVRVFDFGAVRLRNALVPLIRYLRSERPAALQANMWPLTTIAIVASSIAQAGNRVIVTDHSTLSREYANHGRWHSAVLRASLALFYPLATARIAVSRGARDDLASLGVRPDTILVIPNPIHRRATAEQQPFTWPGSGRRLLSVGNLVPAKNQEMLLRSFACFANTQDASLVICGEGELRPKLVSLAAELGIAQRVFFPGYIRDISQFYEAADLFVLSSSWEGFSVVLIEALQAGLPVVATDCEHGPREILDGGRFGILVPVHDEVALANAMADSFDQKFDPVRQKQRAEAIAGTASIDRYESILLGQENS